MSYGPPTEAAASGCPLLSVPQAADEGVGIGAVAHLQTQVLLALLAPLHQLPWLPWQLPKKSSSLKPRPFPRSQVSQGQHPGRLRPHLAGSLCISQGETRVPVGLCGPLLGALGWICFGGRAGRSRFAARWRGGGALVLHSPHLGSAPSRTLRSCRDSPSPARRSAGFPTCHTCRDNPVSRPPHFKVSQAANVIAPAKPLPGRS